jgi:hypothetical protein
MSTCIYYKNKTHREEKKGSFNKKIKYLYMYADYF